MPNQTSLEQIELAELTQSVDDARAATDSFKLIAATRTLRAYRRPAGGTAELAGTSATATVSVVQLGTLTSGVTYEFWLVGKNSQGEGPESNHITHVAT